MKKSKFLIVLMALGLLVTFRFCLPLWKKPSFGSNLNPIHWRSGERLGFLKQLRLTDRQNRLLQQSRARFRRANVLIDSRIELKKTELENELENEDPEMKRIDSLCQQIGVLYGEKLKIRLAYRSEIESKVLTPEQSARVEDFREEGYLKPVNLVLSE